jgi:hypothetical protein
MIAVATLIVLTRVKGVSEPAVILAAGALGILVAGVAGP